MALLLAGGCEDPNLSVLADAAQKANVEFLDLRLPVSESPALSWDFENGAPRFSGKEIKATGAFIRYDVFGGMKDPRPAVRTRASAWYQTLMGWLLSEPGIRIFNRQISQAASNKPAALMLAREAGLRIPSTLITNEADKLRRDQAESMIAKPVLGGDYCYSLPDALAKTDLRDGLAAMPAIVQKRLEPPEVRIYVVGQSAFAFDVRSSSLDYRVNQDAELVLLPEVPQEVSRLRKLMSRLGLDFGAADFKTDPATGELVFLELNTSPMFARFDLVSNGQLCAAMIDELTSHESTPA
jgi:glutathione synthase/RimK-type ligase-like ATP-grasp enzyme